MADKNETVSFLSQLGEKEFSFTDALMMMLQWYLSQEKKETNVVPRMERVGNNLIRWHFGNEYFEIEVKHSGRLRRS